MLLLTFGRRAKDLTDFQLALQHINYVGVWSIWQKESPIARIQMHWPEAPVFIRTRGAVQHAGAPARTTQLEEAQPPALVDGQP